MPATAFERLRLNIVLITARFWKTVVGCLTSAGMIHLIFAVNVPVLNLLSPLSCYSPCTEPPLPL